MHTNKHELRACREIQFWVARATGLCHPATRRVERQARSHATNTACSRWARRSVPVGESPTGTGGSPVPTILKQALIRPWDEPHSFPPPPSSPALSLGEREDPAQSQWNSACVLSLM